MTWCSLCWRFVQWGPHLNRRAPAVITYYSGSTTLVCDVWQERHSHSARLQSPPYCSNASPKGLDTGDEQREGPPLPSRLLQ